MYGPSPGCNRLDSLRERHSLGNSPRQFLNAAFAHEPLEARPPGSRYIVLRQESQIDRYLWCNLSHWLFSLVQPKEQDLSIMPTGAKQFEQTVDFSLVLGGPSSSCFARHTSLAMPYNSSIAV